jgi:hypothetical protein
MILECVLLTKFNSETAQLKKQTVSILPQNGKSDLLRKSDLWCKLKRYHPPKI